MAAIRTIELSDNSESKKGKYTIQEFHNRSSLFPCTQNSKLFLASKEDKDVNININIADGFQLTCKKAEVNKNVSKANSKLPPTGSRALGRTQSAKSRKERTPKISATAPSSKKNHSHQDTSTETETLSNDSSGFHNSRSQAWEETSTTSSKQDSDSGIEMHHSPRNMMLVPTGGKEVPVVDIGDEAPFPSYYFQKKRAQKYVSPGVRGFVFTSPEGVMNNRPFSAQMDHVRQQECRGEQKKRPSSAKSSRVKSDCVPVDITPTVVGMENNRQVCGSTLEIGSTNIGTYPYKLSDGPKDVEREGDHSKKLKDKAVPSCLEPLLPWRNINLKKDDLGVDPSKCYVFLPSISSDQYAELPVVPPPQSAGEDLSYKERIPPSPPPFNPKKYNHPAFNRKPVDEWVCRHSKPSTATSTSTHYYDYIPKRPIGVVRKEIEDLENLLRGIGIADSGWGLVQYQAEIDHFRQTYEETMAKVPERLLEPQEPVDTFGLRKFYSEHDEVMTEIRHRHTLCLMELAELEVDLGIESDRKYFKHQIYLPYEPD